MIGHLVVNKPLCRNHRRRCGLRELRRGRIRSTKTSPSAQKVSSKEKPKISEKSFF